MRILIVNTDYPAFLDDLYARHVGLAERPYSEQLATRAAEPFGLSGFFATNLRALGADVEVVHANNEPLQRAWAREHGRRGLSETTQPAPSRSRDLARRAGASRVLPLIRRARPSIGVRKGWVEEILSAQIEAAKPDVLWCLDMITIDPRVLHEAKRHARLIVGQHGAVDLGHPEELLKVYDLLVSNFPPTIEHFRRLGLDAHFQQLGFEPRLLELLGAPEEVVEVSFVGSFFRGIHDQRAALVERVCAHFGERAGVWAPDVDALPANAAIRSVYRGAAWGLDMFRVLQGSRVTINVHGDMVPHAANCRLFEATGVGTALVTDRKDDLTVLFDVGREVVDFAGADECIEQTEQLLAAREERVAIARAGHARTLAEHTYARRMEEFLGLVGSRL